MWMKILQTLCIYCFAIEIADSSSFLSFMVDSYKFNTSFLRLSPCYKERLKVESTIIERECDNFDEYCFYIADVQQLSINLNQEWIPECKQINCNDYSDLSEFDKLVNSMFYDCEFLNMYNDSNFNGLLKLQNLEYKTDWNADRKGTYILNELLLRDMKNLKAFKLDCDFRNRSKVEIPKQFFKGLNNLKRLELDLCRDSTLRKDHFQDLVGLEIFILNIQHTQFHDFNWLSSTIIQNTLKLLKLIVFEESILPRIYTRNMTAIICRVGRVCEFNVDIHKKPCPSGCFCTFDNVFNFEIESDLILKIRCNLLLSDLEIPELPIPIIGNVSLDISSQGLTQLPTSDLYGYSNIQRLNLANNKLTSLTADQLPSSLNYLDLRNNRLQHLGYNVLEFITNRGQVMLSGNPWICDCDAIDLLDFIVNPKIILIDRNNIKCNNKSFVDSMVFFKVDGCKSYLPYYYLGSLLGLTVMTIIFLFTKNFILMWLYDRNLFVKWILRPEPKTDSMLKIDAFLAFSHKDLELIEEYVDKLEKGPREFQLCFYQRDWLVGESIPDCILKSIEYSKRIIILMTNNFVNSSWGLFELRSAIKATSMDKDKRLIVILYPEVDIDKLEPELKRYMKYNTYLRRDDPLFWRKLIFSMPHKPIPCDQPIRTECLEIEETEL